MQLFTYENIVKVHVELSSYCNAACPFCPRNILGGETRSLVKLRDVGLLDFQRWFPKDFAARIRQWIFCGTVGDPCTCKEIIPIIRYVKACNPSTTIHLNTNGGMRNPEFWAEMGSLFPSAPPRGELVFSIDGLEDTNHIYRRNVNWQRLMANVQAFLRAGGRAFWEFLIFRHNEAQLEEAADLAKRLGFAEFVPKKALGFTKDEAGFLSGRPVYRRDGSLDYVIYPPANSENRNDASPVKYQAFSEFTQTIQPHEGDLQLTRGLETYRKNKRDSFNRGAHGRMEFEAIRCKSLLFEKGMQKAEIFVDCEGNLYPCCFVGTGVNGMYTGEIYYQLVDRIKWSGLGAANLNQKSLRELLDENYLEKVYAETWTKPSIREGKLAYCAQTCGVNNSIDRIWTHKQNPLISANAAQG